MDIHTKIIGWDVGIKNLAYCIINQTNNTFTIDKWEIIDLTEKEEFTCCGLKKKKKSDTESKKCDNPAKFYTNINGETKHYCAIHKKQHIVNFEEIESTHIKPYNNINKEKCKFISKNNKECVKKAMFEFNNNFCCKSHKEIQLKNKLKDMMIKPIKKNKSLADPQILCEKMYSRLSEIKDLDTIDEVYIENQPTHINPIMKTVSALLFSFFVYTFSSKNLTNKTVKFVAPASKIELTKELIEFAQNKINNHNNKTLTKDNKVCNCRLCKLNTDLTTNKTNSSENYKEYKLSYEGTKELGTIYTEKILEDNNLKDTMNMIKDYNKKDDLCDAFLHGYKKMKKVKKDDDVLKIII